MPDTCFGIGLSFSSVGKLPPPSAAGSEPGAGQGEHELVGRVPSDEQGRAASGGSGPARLLLRDWSHARADGCGASLR
jgi:hypothetical protein